MDNAKQLAEKLREFEKYCCAGGARRDILFETIEFLERMDERKDMRKVLVSGGFGAGWSTWSVKPQQVAEYAPIIEFLEAGGNPKDLRSDSHPLIIKMCEDLGLEDFYTGGAKGLRVEEVDPPYIIEEYDGAEYVRNSYELWT